MLRDEYLRRGELLHYFNEVSLRKRFWKILTFTFTLILRFLFFIFNASRLYNTSCLYEPFTILISNFHFVLSDIYQ